MSERPPAEPTAGRSYVTRRAIRDIVRASVAGSYGVTGFGRADRRARILGVLGLGDPGVDIAVSPHLLVSLRIRVAPGVPVAEVARQVDSAVRYELDRAIGREPDRLTILVDGVGIVPAGPSRHRPDSGSVSVAGVRAASVVPQSRHDDPEHQ